jgi:hydroxymethylbilane synthase
VIVIGSRGSQLALWQANHISARLNALGEQTRIEIIKTTGDKIQDVPLAKVGGKGLFTKEIEEALLAGTIDLAVHSMKDVPAEIPEGLTIAAIPEREDPHDALVGKRLAELRDGMRMGTSSLRRSSQLRAMNRRLRIEMLRGNVDTRLRKLDEGQYDAIVLAAAGLKRLGWENRISELISPTVMCPAVGQGALAIETRDDKELAHETAMRLDHEDSNLAVTAERALLRVLGGSCQVPIGAHATIERQDDAVLLHLTAIVASPDGERLVKGDLSGTEPLEVGKQLGTRLLEQGAREILEAVYSA